MSRKMSRKVSRKLARRMPHAPTVRPRRRARWFRTVTVVGAFAFLVASTQPAGADDGNQTVWSTTVVTSDTVLQADQPLTLSGSGTFPDLPNTSSNGLAPAPLLNADALTGKMLGPAGDVVPLVTAADASERSALADLSQTAVANALAAHELPSTDADAMQTWGRDDTLPFLWSLLVQAAQTPAAQRTPDQAQAVRWLNDMQKRQALRSTQYAAVEYAKWAGIPQAGIKPLLTDTPDQAAITNALSANPTPYTGSGNAQNPGGSTDGGFCVYRPPAPYSGEYSGNIWTPWQQGGASYLCYRPCDPIAGCLPPTPTVEQFAKWGATDANASMNGSSSATIIGSVGFSAGMGAAAAVGAPAVGLTAAATLGATMAGGGFEASLFPFAAAMVDFAVQASTTAAVSGSAAVTAEAAATAAGVGGTVAAAGLGAILGAIIFAVAVGVLEGIEVFRDAALPGQIASAIASAATSSPDVSTMTGNASAMQGLYAMFMSATQPAPTYQRCDNSGVHIGGGGSTVPAPCLNPPDVAAAAPGDHVFSVTPEGSSAATTQSTLTWKDAQSGTVASAHVKRNWFVTTMVLGGAPAATIQTLRMRYTDWNGAEHTAWLYDDGSAAQFLTVRNDAVTASFDPAACITSGACAFTRTIQVVDAQGNHVTVGVGPKPVPPVQVDTTTVLSTSKTIPGPGQPVTLTATVKPVDGTVPTGTVMFVQRTPNGFWPTTPVTGCTSVPLSTTAPYTATCVATMNGTTDPKIVPSVGGFAVVGAVYEGDATTRFSPSAYLWMPVSTGSPTSVTLSTDTPDGAFTFRKKGRLIATVHTQDGTAPTGTVRFTDERGNVCDGEVWSPYWQMTVLDDYATVQKADDGTWQAVCDLVGASTYTSDYEPDVGTRYWTAQYSGDATHQSSWATGAFTIDPSPTTTSLTASASQVTQGTPVTFTATVSDPDVFRDQAPTGNQHTVTFREGDKVLCANVPVGPQHGPRSFVDPDGVVYDAADYTTSTQVTATCTAATDPGEQTVTATYNPQAKYAASSATTVVSSGLDSTTQVNGPYNPRVGSPSTYTAVVLSQGLDNEQATGTVTFSIGGTVVCDHVALGVEGGDGGFVTASCAITPTERGSTRVTAHFDGAASDDYLVRPSSGSKDISVLPTNDLPTLHGTVADDATGTALSDVCVSLWSGSTQVQTACTDSTGVYEMDDVTPGDYTVSFVDSHGLHATQWAGTKGTLGIYSAVATQAEATPVTISSGVVTVSGRMSVAPGTISGVVHLADGNTSGQACVYLYRQNGSYAGIATCTNAHGDYVLSGVGNGAYRIAVVDPGGQSPVTWYGDVTDQSAGTVVTALADSALTGIDVHQAPIAPMLRGTVADTAGNPLDGVCVSLWSGAAQLRTACTDDTGVYEMDDVAPGDYTVSFVDSHGLHATQWAGTKGTLGIYSGVATQAEASTISLNAGPDTVSARMAAQTGTISGTVHFASGSPTQRACVYLYFQNGSSAGSSTCTNDHGDYLLGGVANGSYRIAVVDPLGLTPTTWYGNVTEESDGTVVSGFADDAVTGVDVDLGSAPGSIVGRVTDATGTTGLAGICVYAYAYLPPNGDQPGVLADGATAATCTNADGYYNFSGLPRGNGVSYQLAFVDPTGTLPTQWVVSSYATGTNVGTATSVTPQADGAIRLDAFGFAYESPRLQTSVS